jgi:hypothetical protein
MAWVRDLRKSSPPKRPTTLEPVDVLYEYVTPLLFTTDVGIDRQLAYKLEDNATGALFLLRPAEDTLIDYLKKGRLSVRGALLAERYRIVETDDQGAITQVWLVDHQDLPEDFLPESRSGLFEHFGAVPDAIEQSSSFFSARFAGSQLNSESISLRNLKDLVEVFDALVNRIFTPAMLGSRRTKGLIDYQVYQPKLSSLVLSIKEPVIDAGAILRRTAPANAQDQPNVATLIVDEMEKSREDFFDNVEKIVGAANVGTIGAAVRRSQFEWLDLIAELVPDADGSYDLVELNAATDSGLESLLITKTAGERIRDAHRIASHEPKVLKGVVVELNSASCTFIIRSITGRQTTCVLGEELYRRLERNGTLRTAAKVTVSGSFERRSRRDKVIVSEEPTFESS